MSTAARNQGLDQFHLADRNVHLAPRNRQAARRRAMKHVPQSPLSIASWITHTFAHSTILLALPLLLRFISLQPFRPCGLPLLGALAHIVTRLSNRIRHAHFFDARQNRSPTFGRGWAVELECGDLACSGLRLEGFHCLGFHGRGFSRMVQFKSRIWLTSNCACIANLSCPASIHRSFSTRSSPLHLCILTSAQSTSPVVCSSTLVNGLRGGA